MAAVAIVALLVVVVIVLVIIGFVAARGVSSAGQPSTTSADQVELRFPVPAGMDQAVVARTLLRAGFQASTDLDQRNQPVVVITSDAGSLDREKIRAVVREAGVDEIRFADE